jgi:hypothetical protein
MILENFILGNQWGENTHKMIRNVPLPLMIYHCHFLDTSHSHIILLILLLSFTHKDRFHFIKRRTVTLVNMTVKKYSDMYLYSCDSVKHVYFSGLVSSSNITKYSKLHDLRKMDVFSLLQRLTFKDQGAQWDENITCSLMYCCSKCTYFVNFS